MLSDIIKVSQLSFVKFCFGVKKATKQQEDKSEETFKKLKETVRGNKIQFKAQRVHNNTNNSSANEIANSESSND
jgi:hypothetical protein